MRAVYLVTVLMCLWQGALLGGELQVIPPRSDYQSLTLAASPGSPYGRGLVPPPFEPHRVAIKVPRTLLPLPVRFDWREQGVVTSVKQQGSCGACYAFAGLADVESKMLMAGQGRFDFSENNVKECEWFGRTGQYPSKCNGGTYWRIVNLMAEYGTVLEACDPYVSYNSRCKATCPYIKTVLDWRVFSLEDIPPVEVMKSYVMNQGPIFVAIDGGISGAWEYELNNYDGSYTLYYTGSPYPYVNHAVLVVGWDDTLSHAGGQGAWICKNSWGKSWGGTAGYGTEKGYFTIAYGSANIGWYAAFLKDWQDYDPCGRLLFYDEAGYAGNAGRGTKTDWGMCKFVAEEDMIIDRVEFWSTDATTDVDVYIYDDFDGSSLSNLLESQLNRSFSELGYHSIELESPVEVDAGEDFYAAMKIADADYTYPLSYDPIGPVADNKCYESPTGDTWSEFTYGDLGIRVRVRLNRDCDPPGEVSSFRAIGGDRRVTLKWITPADGDFSHVLIRYSDFAYPMHPEEGSAVNNGQGGIFYSEPASADSFVHQGLQTNVTYYYTAFAGDTIPNYSTGVTARATPSDTLPPQAVLAFTATGDDRSVKLNWTNPDDADLAGVVVRYSTEGWPFTLAEGIPVENGEGGVFDAVPSQPDSFLHTGLLNDTAYYYCIWAFDGMGKYSTAECAEAVPEDLVPPEFAISVLQNPYISNHLDIYVVASEPIMPTSFEATVAGDGVGMTVLPGDEQVFKYDYDLYHSGILEVVACGRDLRDNFGCSSRSFGVTEILAAAGGTAGSPDGHLEVSIPGGVLSRDTYVLVYESQEQPGGMEGLYTVSPQGLDLEGPVTLSMHYHPMAVEPEHLCVAVLEGGSLKPLESYLDRAGQRIVAYADRLGTFGLLACPDTETPAYQGEGLRLLGNRPNPFAGSTDIVFSLSRAGRVRAEVFSVDGRLVNTLLDQLVDPGKHIIGWDGTDRAGRRVTGGIYFYRVASDTGSAAGKMVVLK